MDETLLIGLLSAVRSRIYGDEGSERLARDRRRLLYALTWPAHWLDSRGLPCAPKRYEQLVKGCLDAIVLHGDREKYGEYFPSYVPECLQDHRGHREDELHRELRQMANLIGLATGALTFAESDGVQARQMGAMAQVHRLLRAKPPATDDLRQMALF